MKLIAHLSDLHFGRIDEATIQPVIKTVTGLDPDLVAVSGDLTQRARERLDAGRLSLYVTHRTGRWGLALLALRALTGRLSEARDFDALSAKEITIETRRRKQRLRVATDGEVTVMRTPLHYRVRPGDLRVVVPEEP